MDKGIPNGLSLNMRGWVIIAINVVVLLTLKGHVGAILVRGGKVLVQV